MSDGLHERTEQDGHVVAIASAQLEHATRCVQHFDLERILRVAHVTLHPAEERVDFSDVVLGRHTLGQQDVDRFLAHVEVGRALTNESSNVGGGQPGAGQTAGDALATDARRLESWLDVARHGWITPMAA